MKKSIQIALLGLSLISVNALANEGLLDLEPCINGDVSASGLFPSQDAEDGFVKHIHYKSLQRTKSSDLEASTNGEDPITEFLPNQATEDHHRMLQEMDDAGIRLTSTGGVVE